MKKITSVPNFKAIEKEIYLESKDKISEAIESVYNSIPQSDKKYLTRKFRTIMILLGFILIIPWIILYFKTTELKNKFTSSLNQEFIYKVGFEKVPHLEFTGITYSSKTKDLYFNRTAGIPMDATISQATPFIVFKVHGKYDGYIRMGEATWVRSNGKSSTRFYKNTGYLVLDAPGVMPSFNYSLDHKNRFGGKRHNLESTQFNKTFEFESNDQVKARMIYTPLSMEETIKYKSTNNLRYWKVFKNGEQFKIIFQPNDWKDLIINIRNSDLETLETIKNAIYRDISKDIVNIYNIIFVVLIPPML